MRRPIKGGRISICVKTSNCATCVSESNIKGKLFREKQLHSHRCNRSLLAGSKFNAKSLLQMSVDDRGIRSERFTAYIENLKEFETLI